MSRDIFYCIAVVIWFIVGYVIGKKGDRMEAKKEGTVGPVMNGTPDVAVIGGVVAPKKRTDWVTLILSIFLVVALSVVIFHGGRAERIQKAEQERFRTAAQTETGRITQRVGNNVETWMVAFGGLLPEINRQINYYRNAKLSDIQKSKLRERILINEQALLIMQDSITVQIKRNIDKGMENK
ncbi:MAG: hypothetical protein PHX21_13525 [bacterium]|nr:hypothetical protein [bacterium]